MVTGVRVYWFPFDDSATYQYELMRTANPMEDPESVDTILHQIPGPNWDAKTNRFFYDDINGSLSNYYNVLSVTDTNIALGQTGLFTPGGSQGVPIRTMIPVDHNYGGIDALKVIEPGGGPIPYVDILIFKSIDYANGLRDVPIGRTQTNETGRWKSAVMVPPGFDYTLVFSKTSEWGPDEFTITVSPVPNV
jgi:hypothetical protein